LRGILFSIALLGLTISLFYHVIPIEPLYNLPDQLDKFFASKSFFTLWLIIPILVLLI
jgi:hypothetical protein